MARQTETIHERLAYLRTALEQARDELVEAEVKRADRLADIEAFEFVMEANLGQLLDQLAAVEAEVNRYLARIRRMRNERTFGAGYDSVEEQYHRTWHAPRQSKPTPLPDPPSPAAQVEIKRLYRHLARHFHPDLAADERDRAYRTDKMQAINDAYAVRSVAELMALARELEDYQPEAPLQAGQTEKEMVQVLEEELARCRRRLREINTELRELHNHSTVQLALEVKLAQRDGRDLLAEMRAELERQIARKTAERDMLKAQFDHLK